MYPHHTTGTPRCPRTARRTVAGVLAVGALLAACSSDKQAATTTEEASTTTVA
ncbi:MAG: hypothetical protein JWM12_646, partial [Ilumatobacteraceae bacterium]|nr:hypothetical protein [Ilumatobacteraceae bacterium]